MENFIVIIDLLILGLIVSTPILLLVGLKKLNINHSYIYYFLIGLLVLSGIICFSAWWTDKSNLILLEYYGYSFHGMNNPVSYEKVLPENIKRVKEIETDMMGIGWTLKAIFGFVAITLYLLIIYIGNKLRENKRN